MPRVKTAEISYKVLDNYNWIKVDINVNSKGEFYCNVPVIADEYFKIGGEYVGGRVQCWKGRSVAKQLFSKDMDLLTHEMKIAIDACHEPEVTTEHVIRFNIESHVSFCLSPSGEILPNGYWGENENGKRDYQWASQLEKNGRSKFGRHDSQNPSDGGFSLTVGAMAMTKTTRRFGKAEKISYNRYYKGDSHLGIENPAQKLNSWCSFSLPKNAREMPYTDEAAMFFFNLMMGVAKLSRMIQEATFDDTAIQHMIENSGKNLLGFTPG